MAFLYWPIGRAPNAAFVLVASIWGNGRFIVKSDQLIERLAAVFALIVLVGGSLLVLAPFTTALLWGAILSYSSRGSTAG